ncbi:two component, sigma54 specific, transcriptional regulator, Fis family [Pseudodesulfovibrio mercurii]|uniref:Two component, sigma54 specific, transcriptional regulator, Fis family n=1 Tax=Pseudodesulfovibrio mercurii TaxID=641491 RepID=F0JDV8_9BACT|nr:sigma-54 dependent transcriptional regulator [Pseudodesulfovibrio mercurii]EGB13398.1 two component, sigma54 specific, transcriptional regulator, Fis family [Pseudodesulfovibrio mercurii]
MSQRILIVDDEPDFAQGLARLIASGFPEVEISLTGDGAEALEILKSSGVDLMLSDLRMPRLNGQELLHRALEIEPGLTVILVTGFGSVEAAVTALKAGAYDFLTKPVKRDELLRSVQKGLERGRLLGENRALRALAGRCESTLVGRAQAMCRLKESIAAVAASDYNVLICGESGTGKELVAGNIHRLSGRAKGPFVAVNCPAIPEQLLESELFGHVKGAFTGADKARQGLFVSACGGSILLDEIGDISMSMQTKLLRVLQEREIRPVGGNAAVKVDVRILATTNRNLPELISEGEFREDLFYRLNVLTVNTPPLRESREDIPRMAAHFLNQTCLEMHLAPKTLSPEVLACLCERPWHGNVRELQNTVRRLTVFCPGNQVEMVHLRLAEGRLSGPNGTWPGGGETDEGGIDAYKEAKARVLNEFTRNYLEQILARTGGNISEAARLAGLERVSLQKIIKRNGASSPTD